MTSPAEKTQESRSPGTDAAALEREDQSIFEAITKKVLGGEGDKPAKEKAEPKAETKEEPEKDEPGDDEETAYDKATKNLKLVMNMEDEAIARLSKKAAIGLWKSQQERERKHNELLRENAHLKESIAKKKEATEKTEHAPPTVDLDFNKLREELQEEGFGERGAERLASTFDKFASAIGNRDTLIEQLREELSERAARELRRAERSARAELVERFPELSKEDTFRSVKEHMAGLLSMPRFQAIEDPEELAHALMEAGARAANVKEVGDEDKERTRRVRAKQDEGSAEVTDRGLHAQMSDEQRDRAVFDHLMKHNGDVDGAQKLYLSRK